MSKKDCPSPKHYDAEKFRRMCPQRKTSGAFMASMLKGIGPKYIEIYKLFIPSAMCFSTAALVAGIYICDWKALLKYMPYYGGKYPPEEEPDDD